MSLLPKSVKSILRSVKKSVRQRGLSKQLLKAMPDLTPKEREIIEQVQPNTLLSSDRIYAFMEATRHVVQNNIPGSIVECGVWKGGAVMSSLLTLIHLEATDRQVYLYDTFEGMPKPGEDDKRCDGDALDVGFAERQVDEDSSTWCRAEYGEVHENITSCEYPAENIHFVKGKVEETIPETLPEQISVLRLDTDWYESTKHELENLYPLLAPGGVLIIDDYGHWEGAREAVDEYFASHKIPMMLHRTDYTGRVGVKAA
ncbi:MAG: class I SAM-dependent methyltransferase [Planctomycetaceae bacterium]|nr:class I SAM-dependent methyltransferase [Planctomycetaceae bacterium]